LRTWSRTQLPLYAVVSTSMVPTLNVGDLIIVQGVEASTVRVGPKFEGEIIVFQSPTSRDDFIVHRAIYKELNPNDHIWYFRTQGDNSATNSSPDVWSGPGTWNGMVSQELIMGKVVEVVPWFGNLSLFIRTPEGLLLIIALIIILIFLDLAEYVPSLMKKTPASKSDD
jgi:signal peptidase I